MADDDDTEDAKFEEKFNKYFHKAFGEREKRLMKKFDETLTTKLEGVTETIGNAMEERLNKWLEDDDNTPPERKNEGDGANKGGMSEEAAAQLRQAQKDAKEAKDLAEKHKKEADAEREKTRKQQERSELQAVLTGRVQGPLVDMVVGDLHSKRIVRDKETDAILWKNDDGELVPFKDGVEAWAKSDAGKAVAPARPVNGGGSRGGSDEIPTKPGTMTYEGIGAIVTGTRR